MADFGALASDYAGKVTVAVVYLREAHASDEWPLGAHSYLAQPTRLEERLDAAARFVAASELSVPVLVDSLSDGFMKAYGAHPMRYFVFHEGRCTWSAEPYKDYPKFHAGYQLDDCRPVLNDIIFNKEQKEAWAAAATEPQVDAVGQSSGNVAKQEGNGGRCVCS